MSTSGDSQANSRDKRPLASLKSEVPRKLEDDTPMAKVRCHRTESQVLAPIAESSPFVGIVAAQVASSQLASAQRVRKHKTRKRHKEDREDMEDRMDWKDREAKMDTEDKTGTEGKMGMEDTMDTVDKKDSEDTMDTGDKIDREDKMDMEDKMDREDKIDSEDKEDKMDREDKMDMVDKMDREDTMYREEKMDWEDKMDTMDAMDQMDASPSLVSSLTSQADGLQEADVEAEAPPPARVEPSLTFWAAPPTEARRWRGAEMPINTAMTVITTTDIQRETLEAAEQFKDNANISWPEELPGTFLTYGWVLIVNTWARPFLLLTTIALAAAVPPMAASCQATVFFLNFGLILAVMPYSNDMLSLQEALLVGCLALLTWGAAFRDLLQNHARAQDFPETVVAVGNVIDGLCIIILAIMLMGIVTNLTMAIQGFLAAESVEHATNRAFAWRWQCMRKARENEMKAWLHEKDTQQGSAAIDLVAKSANLSDFSEFALQIMGAQQSLAQKGGVDAMEFLFKAFVSQLCPQTWAMFKKMTVAEFVHSS